MLSQYRSELVYYTRGIWDLGFKCVLFHFMVSLNREVQLAAARRLQRRHGI